MENFESVDSKGGGQGRQAKRVIQASGDFLAHLGFFAIRMATRTGARRGAEVVAIFCQ